MYFLPTILPCSGRYSGQRVHKKMQFYALVRNILEPDTNSTTFCIFCKSRNFRIKNFFRQNKSRKYISIIRLKSAFFYDLMNLHEKVYTAEAKLPRRKFVTQSHNLVKKAMTHHMTQPSTRTHICCFTDVSNILVRNKILSESRGRCSPHAAQ
jgi:hypothetical protein